MHSAFKSTTKSWRVVQITEFHPVIAHKSPWEVWNETYYKSEMLVLWQTHCNSPTPDVWFSHRNLPLSDVFAYYMLTWKRAWESIKSFSERKGLGFSPYVFFFVYLSPSPCPTNRTLLTGSNSYSEAWSTHTHTHIFLSSDVTIAKYIYLNTLSAQLSH